MYIQPYLNFEGRADEAIEFYQRALDAKVEMIMRFKEMPGPPPSQPFPASMMDKVMHSTLTIGDSVINMTDGRCGGHTSFAGITMSLSVKNQTEADKCFAALSEAGHITMPLSKTFFSPRFGMLTDRFGVSWIVMVHPPH